VAEAEVEEDGAGGENRKGEGGGEGEGEVVAKDSLASAEERWFNLKADALRARHVLPRCPRCDCTRADDGGGGGAPASSGDWRSGTEAVALAVPLGAAPARPRVPVPAAEAEAAASRDLALAEAEVAEARGKGVFENEGALRDHMTTCCPEVCIYQINKPSLQRRRFAALASRVVS
jgi:hypothetical protein